MRNGHSKTTGTQFLANKSPYLKNGARYDQGYAMTDYYEVVYALSIGTKVDDLG